MKYSNIREESLKFKVRDDFFSKFDVSVEGDIDFSVSDRQQDLFSTTAPLLWAEAKVGKYDIIEMFTQLIITIGKAKTFDKILPPPFLGVFDYEKIAFVEYLEIQGIFYENDFNRNVAPSNHNTREFKLVYDRIAWILKRKTWIFDFEQQEQDIKDFIENILSKSKSSNKITINKNNFFPIYLRWEKYIKPEIDVDRDELKEDNILDADFFLADLFVNDHNTTTITDDESIKQDLFVIFENGGYTISKKNLANAKFDANIKIKNPRVYELFWKTYIRPPAKKYQEYIAQRRDLIVPQDFRETKGAFFTPRIWVEKSQEYIENFFGEDYQDKYYIWDCCAGTGNLLVGLTNKYNIYASTLDMADVIVMKDMVKNNSINLLDDHIFQFDFLDGDFSKLPESLLKIINDKEERKKLIVYINPPYAEATNAKTVAGTGKNKAGTSIKNKIYKKYKGVLGNASNELYAQFLIRIYKEIPGCKIANFSKLKNLLSQNFGDFRNIFLPELERLFIAPGKTFDNVTGNFPIGFFIWDGERTKRFDGINADIYDKNGNYMGTRFFNVDDDRANINKRIKTYDKQTSKDIIGYLGNPAPDFQHNKQMYISYKKGIEHFNFFAIDHTNIIPACIYFSVRQCIIGNRTNDRDQFFEPINEWENDKEFQNNCLIFTIFHGQNRITSREKGNNYRIPFKEAEVDARERFSVSFMYDFCNNRQFSSEAINVLEAGKNLRKYYHKNCKGGYLVNASYYEIREYFQGRDNSGKMKSSSDDSEYLKLLGELKSKMNLLAIKIAEKVYEYEFLKR